jgi:hypothetical protein
MPRSLLILLTWMMTGCTLMATQEPILPTPTPPPIPTDLPQTEQIASTPPEAATEEPSPEPPELIQLTQPGCCVQPFWSADGSMVLFIDQPQPTASTGIYGVRLAGGDEELISERIGLPSPDGRYLAYLSASGETIVEPIDSSTQWVIPNGGLRVFFSPKSERLAWAAIPQSGNFDERPAVISVSDIDGSDSSEIITIYGGGIGGWLDDDHLLLVGRDRGRSQDVALFSIAVTDGTRTDLITNQRIRSVQIAPGGGWVAYTISLNTEDSAEDGLWVIRADGGERYKLEVAGAAHWRDATHLLLIPFEDGAQSHRLWEFSVESGQAYPLTDPAVTPFKVSSGDWSVSPNGDHLVFLANDQSLWVLTIPDSPPQN